MTARKNVVNRAYAHTSIKTNLKNGLKMVVKEAITTHNKSKSEINALKKLQSGS